MGSTPLISDANQRSACAEVRYLEGAGLSHPQYRLLCSRCDGAMGYDAIRDSSSPGFLKQISGAKLSSRREPTNIVSEARRRRDAIYPSARLVGLSSGSIYHARDRYIHIHPSGMFLRYCTPRRCCCRLDAPGCCIMLLASFAGNFSENVGSTLSRHCKERIVCGILHVGDRCGQNNCKREHGAQ
jgi:hypothetical protein